ncbi:GAF domain-containing protein [Candidatus Marinimicrobia bacterium]|nr:GAF domain-containing protein [Candidatus Neomarinimicrobiota bacterium]
MASKGAIIVVKKEKDTHFLATQGFSKEINPSDLFKDLNKKKKQNLFYIDEKNTSINNKIKEDLKKQKIKILIPLFHRQDLLGVFCIGNKFMNQSFTDLDIKIMSIISSHLTKALYNHHLIKELDSKKREISLKLLELETLFDISVAISSVLNVDELSEDVLWRSVGILNASKGMLLIQKKDNLILEPISTFNWDEEKSLISKKLKVFQEIKGNKKGLFLVEKDKTTLQKKLKESNLIITPLQVKNKTLGYMVLCNKETRKGVEEFNSLDLDLLMALSNQAAVAMENAALFKDITKEKNFNESILSSIATGVITINILGEIDSINSAGLKILKKEKEDIIGNHYMYLFEKDEEIIELIIKTETKNEKNKTVNIPFLSVSEETRINFSASPRVDKDKKIKGSVLAIEDITDVSKIKKTFKRYVSKQVVDKLLEDDAKLNLGGEKREVTVLFSDIRGFTSMSEKMEPEKVVSTLNSYFSLMIDIVFKNNGTLDKIIGDELMIVFGAPTSSKDDTERAVKTAIEMQDKIKTFNKQQIIENEKPIKVGIGINKGLVVSGNIGSKELMDYTVIGDTVNLGARLCSAAGPDEIITSDSVWFETKKTFNYKKLKPIKVKGKRSEVQVYKIQK